MAEVKRLQDLETMAPVLNHQETKMNTADWKLTVQKAVDRIVCRFVSLPPNRQTGLQLLRLVGEEWMQAVTFLSMPKHILEQILAKLIHQLLKILIHNLTYKQNLGYREMNAINGHVLIDHDGRRQIHVYLLDESLPKVCEVYQWYLAAHAHREEVDAEEVIVHFLLEEKQIAFSAPKIH